MGKQSVCSTQQLVGAPVVAKVAYWQSAAYPDKPDGLSRRVSGPEDPAEPRDGTPCGV